jgi:hypothetical protein
MFKNWWQRRGTILRKHLTKIGTNLWYWKSHWSIWEWITEVETNIVAYSLSSILQFSLISLFHISLIIHYRNLPCIYVFHLKKTVYLWNTFYFYIFNYQCNSFQNCCIPYPYPYLVFFPNSCKVVETLVLENI